MGFVNHMQDYAFVYLLITCVIILLLLFWCYPDRRWDRVNECLVKVGMEYCVKHDCDFDDVGGGDINLGTFTIVKDGGRAIDYVRVRYTNEEMYGCGLQKTNLGIWYINN